LAEKVKPRLDGIIFDSSQTQNQEQNIILFHNSCVVEPYNLPIGTTVSIDYEWSTDDDCDDSITVLEELTQNTSQEEQSRHINEIEIQDDLLNNRDITLRLNVNEDIDVMVIKGATYQSDKRYTSRYRIKKNVDESNSLSDKESEYFLGQI
jgi:hypothetical protein